MTDTGEYTCGICGREKTGYGIKRVQDGYICRRGICTRIYSKWGHMLNSRIEFERRLKEGTIEAIDRGRGYGGILYRKRKK